MIPDHPALVLVDLQVDFLAPDGRLPVSPAQVPGLLDTVGALAAAARGAGAPVAHVVNAFPKGSWLNLFRRFAAIAGTEGARVDPRAPQPRSGELLHPKATGDAFARPGLAAWLHEQGVRTIVLCGVFANACVRQTARGALAAGFDVVVPREAVAAGSTRSRDRGLANLTRLGARVLPAAEVRFPAAPDTAGRETTTWTETTADETSAGQPEGTSTGPSACGRPDRGSVETVPSVGTATASSRPPRGGDSRTPRSARPPRDVHEEHAA